MESALPECTDAHLPVECVCYAASYMKCSLTPKICHLAEVEAYNDLLLIQGKMCDKLRLNFVDIFHYEEVFLEDDRCADEKSQTFIPNCM